MTDHTSYYNPKIKLSIGKILLGAFLLPWSKRARLSQALAISFFTLTVLGVYWFYQGAYLGTYKQIPGVTLYWVVLTPFAVACHRLLLLSDRAVPAYGIVIWSIRETRFLGWFLLIGLIYYGVFILSMTTIDTIIFNITGVSDDKATWWAKWGASSFLIPASYIWARISLILPGVALEQKPRLSWAWEISRGNGWRLLLLLGALPWVFTQIIGILSRQDATLVEVALLAAAVNIFLVFEISALSLSYKELAMDPVAVEE